VGRYQRQWWWCRVRTSFLEEYGGQCEIWGDSKRAERERERRGWVEEEDGDITVVSNGLYILQ
jgi:hypothetical protein